MVVVGALRVGKILFRVFDLGKEQGVILVAHQPGNTQFLHINLNGVYCQILNLSHYLKSRIAFPSHIIEIESPISIICCCPLGVLNTYFIQGHEQQSLFFCWFGCWVLRVVSRLFERLKLRAVLRPYSS